MNPKKRGRKRKSGARPPRRPAPRLWPAPPAAASPAAAPPVVPVIRAAAARPATGHSASGSGGESDDLRVTTQRLADDVYLACEPFRALTGDDTDPLEAELHAVALLRAVSRTWSILDASLGMTSVAARYPEAHVAAAVAAVQHFTPGLATTMALRDLHARGIRPPAWAARLGDVTATGAQRYRDVFGEREAFLVSFTYNPPADDGPEQAERTEQAEHAVLAEIDHCPDPRLVRAQISRNIDELRDLAASAPGLDGCPLRVEEIAPAEAGPLLQAALDSPRQYGSAEALLQTLALQPRVQALTRDHEAPPTRDDHHLDGAATVRSFLDAVPPPTGVDADDFAFWARAATLCAEATGSSPERLGPNWLGHVLGEFVPTTFELSPGQRAALSPAVTAWSRWAADRQGLPDATAQLLANRVAELDTQFDKIYADSDRVAKRASISDLAAQARDSEHLEQLRARRHHALPPPGSRGPETEDLPVNDPVNRHQILAEYLRTWDLSDTESLPDWLAALTSVSDQLWDAEPPELADAARDYLAHGPDDLLLGDLTEIAVEHAADRARFLHAARKRLTIYDTW